MAIVAVAWSNAAVAQNPATDVVAVEEDWEMVLGTPAPAIDAPQVTTVISPLTIDAAYAAFDINHKTYPEYASGGLQLHVWNPDVPLLYKNSPVQGVLSTPGESVRWTQRMSLNGGILTFDIVSGTSTTWGTFGGQGYLALNVSAALANLNGYDPGVSVDNSGVGHASHRVQSLVLKKVRRYGVTGLISEDSEPRVVHQLD